MHTYLEEVAHIYTHTRRQVYVPTTHWWCGLGNCDLNRDAAL